MGLFDRLKQHLTKSRQAISDGITGLFRAGRPIDEAMLAELEELLYLADLGPVATQVSEELARAHRRGEIAGEADVRAHMRRLLLARLGESKGELDLSSHPTVVLVAGVNGSGKTTSIAKLAHRFRRLGKRVIVAACDTFRAAASAQLAIWAERSGVEIVRKGEGADPAAVAFDAVEAALARDADVLIVDTAGRLHTQLNLMQELEKIARVIRRRIPDAPHECLLVLDATNGQNAVQQAREFTAAVRVTGLVVAKLDGTARGGAIFGIEGALGIPVRYVGTGESLEALELFEPEAFVDALVRSDEPAR